MASILSAFFFIETRDQISGARVMSFKMIVNRIIPKPTSFAKPMIAAIILQIHSYLTEIFAISPIDGTMLVTAVSKFVKNIRLLAI